MADLEKHASDVDAIRSGAWENPGPEWDGMELRVRGFGPHYTEPLAKAQAEAVRKARADNVLRRTEGWDDLPLSDRNTLNDAMMLKHIFLDVRGLSLKGQPVSADEFRALAVQPAYRDFLMGAVYVCADVVSGRRKNTQEAAEGNSSKSSNTSLSGDHEQTS
jgi:hypothetical protein